MVAQPLIAMFARQMIRLRNWIKMHNLKAQVRAERNELLSMSDRQLQDIGKTREQVENEARRSYSDVPKSRKIYL